MPGQGKDFKETTAGFVQREQPAAGEKPREVYLNGRAAIAAELAGSDFIYAQSSQKLTRKSGAFTYQVNFQSSHFNAASERVLLWMHAYVFSPVIKKWRSRNPCFSPNTGFVAGGQIVDFIKETT